MKKLQISLVVFLFFGCGVPKDVYYSNLEKEESTHQNEQSIFSIGVRKDRYYSTSHKPNSTQHKKNSNRKSDPDVNRHVTNKEKFNNEINPEIEIENSRVYSKPNSLTYQNYAPPISIDRKAFVSQSKKYLGVRYKWGGNTPQSGLDCSGFVMNVFNDFGIKTPRVSRDIAMYGQEVPIGKAQVGDLIFFTGRNHASGIIGHLGIIVKTHPKIEFIHSATTNNIGVIITEFKGYYQDHFVKVMSVLH